jgi:hypothetical protein
MKKKLLKNLVPLILFSALLFFMSETVVAQWLQIGSDIDGEATFDYSGLSVSICGDGKTIAIGAPGNDGAGSASGHVRVYNWSSNTWIQKGSDINGEAAGDQSGECVSINEDGSIVVIGAPYNDGTGLDAGHVRVFKWDSVSWIQMGADIDGEAPADYAGFSVCISADSNVIAIGSRGNDGNGSDAGHTRIYYWDSNAWIQKGVDIDGEAAGDFSGNSVSLSADGNIVAIGSPSNDANGNDAGNVRIYQWNGSAWIQKGSDIDGEAADNWAGYSVCLNRAGNKVIIGAPANSDSAQYAGQVRIYEWSGSDWIQKGMDINSRAIVENEEGWAVSMSAYGDTIAIGAHAGGWYTGYVHVYRWDGFAWLQLGDVIDTLGEAGFAVSLSNSGSVVAMGGHLDNGSGLAAGHARVYSDISTGVLKKSSVEKFSVFPNPTEGTFILDLGAKFHDVTITVKNILGQVVSSQEFTVLEKTHQHLFGPKGIYIAEIKEHDILLTTIKICKQ